MLHRVGAGVRGMWGGGRWSRPLGKKLQIEKRYRVGAGVVEMWGGGPCGRPLGGKGQDGNILRHGGRAQGAPLHPTPPPPLPESRKASIHQTSSHPFYCTASPVA